MTEATKKSRAVLVQEFITAGDPKGSEFAVAMEEALALLPEEYRYEFEMVGEGELPSSEFFNFWENNVQFQEAAKKVFAKLAEATENLTQAARTLAK